MGQDSGEGRKEKGGRRREEGEGRKCSPVDCGTHNWEYVFAYVCLCEVMTVHSWLSVCKHARINVRQSVLPDLAHALSF